MSAQDDEGWAVYLVLTASRAAGAVMPCRPSIMTHRYSCVTCGAMKDMTKGFWRGYGDEANAPFRGLDRRGPPQGGEPARLGSAQGRRGEPVPPLTC